MHADEPLPHTARLAWPAPAWHPLFFDLAFVAVILALSAALSTEPTPGMAAWLALTFIALWLTWFVAMLLEPHQPPGAKRVAVVTTQMALLLLAALAADDTFEDNTPLVALLVGAALVLSIALLRRDGRWIDRRTAIALATAGAVWAASAVLWSTWLVLIPWAVALVAMAYAAARLLRSELTDPHRIAHRLGELTVIVIGEAFVKIALATGEVSLTEFSVPALLVAFGLSALIWWAYFITPTPAVLSRRAAGVWVGSHAAVHLGLVGLAVGLAKLLVYADELAPGYLAGLLAAPLALVAAGLAGLAWSAGQRLRNADTIRYAVLAASLAAAGAAGAGRHWPARVVAMVMLVAVASTVLLTARSRAARAA